MIYQIKGKDWCVELTATDNGVLVSGGNMGQITLVRNRLFGIRMKNTENGKDVFLSSDGGWRSVETEQTEGKLVFIFSGSPDIAELSVKMTALYDEKGITWSGELSNTSPVWSAMTLGYPTPAVTGEACNFFHPMESGQVIAHAEKPEVFEAEMIETRINYPSRKCAMQFYAVYGDKSGMYLGFHDGGAYAKEMVTRNREGNIHIESHFCGIGASLPGNSFKLSGSSRWEMIEGDWYDACMIYADFVKREAEWLPKIDKNGRPDTENRFKDLPFWIMDAMPNTEAQGDNCPKNLTSDSDKATPDYWYERPVRLAKKLGVPTAYHIYNWHETPFNLDYPHYHSKPELVEKMDYFRENGVYVMPYINAVSWEMNDHESGFEVNYNNTGKYGVSIMENGAERFTTYPQVKKSGTPSHLAPICPTYKKWWDIMDETSAYMMNDMKVDGIYYDQVAAFSGYPCYSRDHGHLPGGGNYWAREYTSMMEKIRERENHGFCFTECNSEPYMKGYDGYLTWTWVMAGEVPAFAAVYAGYVTMLGRSLDGIKKEDDAYFRYGVARSLLYGQQIGWCKSDVVDNEKKYPMLESVVKKRYEYAEFFRAARMCRFPNIETSAKPIVTSAALWYKTPITMPQVEGCAWKSYDGDKVVLFLTNASLGELDYKLSFSASEYGIDTATLPTGFEIDEDTVTASGFIKGSSCLSFEFKTKCGSTIFGGR